MKTKYLIVLGAVALVGVILGVWSPRKEQRAHLLSDGSLQDHRGVNQARNLNKEGIQTDQPANVGDAKSLQPIRPSTPMSEISTPSGGSDSEKSGSSGPSLTPEVRMHFVRSTLQDYRSVYGGNPIGSNAEITAALLGKNAKRTQFLRSDDRNLNERGELTDHWGSPYFLHQISGKSMEIRSAGPDKTLWTGDDLTVK